MELQPDFLQLLFTWPFPPRGFAFLQAPNLLHQCWQEAQHVITNVLPYSQLDDHQDTVFPKEHSIAL